VKFKGLEQHLIRLEAIPEHDEGLWLDQSVGVFLADDRGLQHSLVGDQRRLDVEGRNPHAADLEHVIGAPAVIVVAVGVAPVFVASMGPFAGKGAPALGALVPVAFTGRRPAHNQFADFAVGHISAVLVDDASVIAGDRFAGRAIANVGGAVAQESVQHFG
jgi:hypothetical protein